MSSLPHHQCCCDDTLSLAETHSQSAQSLAAPDTTPPAPPLAHQPWSSCMDVLLPLSTVWQVSQSGSLVFAYLVSGLQMGFEQGQPDPLLECGS